MRLPKINGDKVVLFVEGTVFHCNTLDQNPNYYLTTDLAPALRGLRIDDSLASATYAKSFLEVYIPLIGSKEAIAEAIRWNDPDEIRAKNANNSAKKRDREAEVEEQLKQKAQEKKEANKNKKKKGNNSVNNKNKKSNGQKKQSETNRVSKRESAMVDEIAQNVMDKAEGKVQSAQKKTKSKEEWLASEKKAQEVKRKAKHQYADTIKEKVTEIVKDRMAGGNKKSKGSAKKAPQKPKKSVNFAK